jgi:CheY-like chemotaxis protein
MKNILLADDDADDRLFFEDALNEVGIPARLTIACNGLELMTNLDSISEPPPLIIFLDLNMPRKNGFECLEEIRNSPRLKHIPVIIFSTTSHEDAISTTFLKGANHYISKPSSFTLLVKAIATVLAKDMLTEDPPTREEFVLKIF